MAYHIGDMAVWSKSIESTGWVARMMIIVMVIDFLPLEGSRAYGA